MRIRSKSLLLVLVFVACTGTLIALVGFTFSRVRIEKAELTGREREVAARLLEGLTSKEIGRTLDISHRTVEIYRARLMRKYNASTAADLVHKLLAG